MLEPILRRRGYLGVAVGEREAVFAFVNEETARYLTVHLRHLQEPFRKQSRFQQTLKSVMHRPVKGIAVVYTNHRKASSLIIAQRALVEGAASHRDIPLVSISALAVRRRCGAPGTTPGNREVMKFVAQKYQIAAMADNPFLPSGKKRHPSGAQRLLHRAALAIAAAQIMEQEASAPRV